MVSRYVIVSTNTSDKVIKDGPILWDGTSAFTIPAGMIAILESNAIAQGYTSAPLPVASVNTTTLQQRAVTAIDNNVTYLGITNPTQAQAVTQVAALTRQVDALIKLLLNQINDTTGT